MTRRGPNEGSIFERQDGRWAGSVHMGWVDGKRVRKHVIAHTRNLHDDYDMGKAENVDFFLPNSDRLDNYWVELGRVEEVNDAGGRRGETSVTAARRHTSNEHITVFPAIKHANAITEYGTAGKWT